MPVKKTPDGTYQARLQIDGRRYARNFPTAREAKIWEANTRKQASDGTLSLIKDNRTLLALIEDWYNLHGSQLADGQKRLSKLRGIASRLKNPVARHFTAEQFAEYRTKRIDSGISKNNQNHEHAYLSAVFNELIRLDSWPYNNPLKNLRKLRIEESDVKYLELFEIHALLNQCRHSRNEDLFNVVCLALSTGARWGEAQNLRREQLHPYRVTYQGTQTKSGKSRTIPISEELYHQLSDHSPITGRLFNNCERAFSNAINQAGIELLEGQRTHILRHTFASHFMMSGGDLLTLNKILGHSTIQMTMRYAHLSPDHLSQAIEHNPLALEWHGTRKNGTETAR
ncbi:phage integrase [Gynuella sunshinyii]|uniref:Site-specific recombinase XerD n=1 Tax=Gynuella sunshinyii YC6258 TaxID=1445510 RepID=A0A0C5V8Y5_9GAMM|nr:tyrosine-type recombinase/integrase [Gynuella sunshinyii]AJQ95820.1 site-specific recombinase XerD [Gynuella sunshinyii YC6258]